MNRPLTFLEHRALFYLKFMCGHAMTWEIARACGLIDGRRCQPEARYMLRRLERAGYVARGTTPAGHYACWSLTDTGRKAVQP